MILLVLHLTLTDDICESFKKYFPYLSGSTHLCCEACLNGTWKIIDATWDPALRQAGFSVNDPWDGMSETIPAVTRRNESREQIDDPPYAHRKERGKFILHLNHWFEEIRRGNEFF